MKPKSVQLILLLSALSVTLSCGSKKVDSQNSSKFELIKLTDKLDEKHTIKLSYIGVQEIEYVQLETNENTLNLGKPYKVYAVSSELLLVKYFRKMALFDRKTGEYLRDIGRYGDDPFSYGVVMASMNDRFDQGLVSAFSRKFELLEYSMQTDSIINRMSIIKMLRDNEELLLDNPVAIWDLFIKDSDNIYGFLANISGNSPFRLIHFNNKGIVKKVYPAGQFLTVDPTRSSADPGEGKFYQINDELMFKEQYSDTVFKVQPDALEPNYVFQLGEKSPPYQDKNKHRFHSRAAYDRRERAEPYVDRTIYVFIETLFEIKSHVLFSLYYKEQLIYGVYNKLDKTTSISNDSKRPVVGFFNDLDYFLPFYPRYVNEYGELVGIIQADEVYEWFQDNPEKIANLRNELRSFQDIQPEDNPIVMIGQIK